SPGRIGKSLPSGAMFQPGSPESTCRRPPRICPRRIFVFDRAKSSMFRSTLRHPKLGVRWSIPDEFKPTDPTLTIVNLAGKEAITTIRLAKEANQLELPLPAAPLEVTLKSGPWSLR